MIEREREKKKISTQENMLIPLYCHVLPIIMDDEPTIGTSDWG